MTTYRVGSHHGVTIVAYNDGARCGRPDHDCARGHLDAVVIDGGVELAERICRLLNADEDAARTGLSATESAEWPQVGETGPPDGLAALSGGCSCGHEGLAEMFHLRPCPVAERRIVRRNRPAPAPVGAGCVCDGTGRACPRHGVVL